MYPQKVNIPEESKQYPASNVILADQKTMNVNYRGCCTVNLISVVPKIRSFSNLLKNNHIYSKIQV
jgi:hypothetical protein